MTVRPGQFGELIAPSQTNGSAAGRTYSLNNSAWAVLAAIHVTYVATATVGNRQIGIRVLDAAGNRLFSCNQQSNVTAGGNLELNWGAGMPAALTSIPGASLPVEMPLPPNAQLQVFDLANIDVNDTQQVNAVFAM